MSDHSEPAHCDHCGRAVTELDAMFCVGCGAPVRPVTVPVTEPPALEPVPQLPSPPAPAPPPPPPPVAPGDNRVAAYIALASVALSLVGAFQVWLRITVGGFAPLGSDATGLEGGDGRTVVGAAIVGAV